MELRPEPEAQVDKCHFWRYLLSSYLQPRRSVGRFPNSQSVSQEINKRL